MLLRRNVSHSTDLTSSRKVHRISLSSLTCSTCWMWTGEADSTWSSQPVRIQCPQMRVRCQSWNFKHGINCLFNETCLYVMKENGVACSCFLGHLFQHFRVYKINQQQHTMVFGMVGMITKANHTSNILLIARVRRHTGIENFEE